MLLKHRALFKQETFSVSTTEKKVLSEIALHIV